MTSVISSSIILVLTVVSLILDPPIVTLVNYVMTTRIYSISSFFIFSIKGTGTSNKKYPKERSLGKISIVGLEYNSGLILLYLMLV